VITQFVEGNCKTLGILGIDTLPLSPEKVAAQQPMMMAEIAQKCENIKFNREVIELVNQNHVYMKPEEKKVVL